MCTCVECLGYAQEAGEEAHFSYVYEIAREWYANASVMEISEFVVRKNICSEFGDTTNSYVARVIAAKAKELATTKP